MFTAGVLLLIDPFSTVVVIFGIFKLLQKDFLLSECFLD